MQFADEKNGVPIGPRVIYNAFYFKALDSVVSFFMYMIINS